jgi:hypothetical protein
MDGARLPNGLWLTSQLGMDRLNDGSIVYSCWALLPMFDGEELRTADSGRGVSIHAKGLVAVVSSISVQQPEPILTYQHRVALATDQAMLDVLNGQETTAL